MKLKVYLDQNQKTPSSFAAEMGVHASTITRIVNGKRGVGGVLAFRIEEETGGAVTARELLADAGEVSQ